MCMILGHTYVMYIFRAHYVNAPIYDFLPPSPPPFFFFLLLLFKSVEALPYTLYNKKIGLDLHYPVR